MLKWGLFDSRRQHPTTILACQAVFRNNFVMPEDVTPTLTSYDVVAYPSYTHNQTHPDRLAVIGRLFGLKPAPVERCRVLELGCGNASNLVPMAWSLPKSEFFGIDLAAKAIQLGEEMTAALGLSNIHLVRGSITELDDSWGQFDYIIAHGLYSWVPAEIRERLLAICRSRLAPQGIAFVSYNALPGCHLRTMLREMMLFHIRGFSAPEERTRQAKSLISFLAEAQDTNDPYRLWLRAELETLRNHEDGHLFHDELAEISDPLYFTQFVQKASSHGLQYLAEADYFEMFPCGFKQEIRQTLNSMIQDRILREQYLDFLKCRRFRQTLLCHAEAALKAPSDDTVRAFLVSSSVTCKSGEIDLRPDVTCNFETAKGALCGTDFPLGKAVLHILGKVWPAPLPFTELLYQAHAALPLPVGGTTSTASPSSSLDPQPLSSFLLQLYAGGIVDFRTVLPPFVREVSSHPVASPIARWQAQSGNLVATVFHIGVRIEDEIGRCLLSLLDGSLDHAALVDKLWAFLKSKNALVIPNGDESAARRDQETKLEENLQQLAKLGLLVN
jgi:SAM-dependent methyltransferase